MQTRFPIGLSFERRRFPKAKETTTYTIDDIHTTSNSAGTIVKLEYLVSHKFDGQPIPEMMCDTAIARSLSNEQLLEFIK